MCGIPYVAVNDGFLGVNYPGNTSGSDRGSEAPCKPRDAGDRKRSSGERETFTPEVFGQEVAELIGGVFAQHEKLLFKHDDQESFVTSMHGTVFYISAAYFSRKYFQYLETGQYSMTDCDNMYLWVRRSIQFDLRDTEQRVQALELLLALITYVLSGNARVNIVTATEPSSNL
ncbi:hypothetical protein AJ79_09631 [Helicocarpus griseus UAMH5409]|uniref:Uncharacterized protein n=1 Tax=Helicocarpus griseus UAMH5409 TaxID=1447875 RepID=A0A2B7WI83_9EURO|nr:hypothetical protein AJ79_09631 [Helicocarpus griseus UAMH5409]